MMLYLNGSFVPEEQAVISAFDRGFLYGDGLFETIRASTGHAFLLREHLARLERGAAALGILLPQSPSMMAQVISSLLDMNRANECLVRVTLSRGPGVRGYSPRGAKTPTLMISLHELPKSPETLRQWRLTLSSMQASDPLAQYKTSNKLVQVMARAEADHAEVDDALLLHPDGTVAETTCANVFWVKSGSIHTNPVNRSVLPGITRQLVLELCREYPLPTVEGVGLLEDILDAEGVFVTQTTYGIVEVVSLGEKKLRRSGMVSKLHAKYHERLHASTR